MFNPAPRYGLQERRRSVQLLAGKEGDVPTHQSRQRGCKERKRITRGHSQQPHRPMPTWEPLVQQLVAPATAHRRQTRAAHHGPQERRRSVQLLAGGGAAANPPRPPARLQESHEGTGYGRMACRVGSVQIPIKADTSKLVHKAKGYMEEKDLNPCSQVTFYGL